MLNESCPCGKPIEESCHVTPCVASPIMATAQYVFQSIRGDSQGQDDEADPPSYWYDPQQYPLKLEVYGYPRIVDNWRHNHPLKANHDHAIICFLGFWYETVTLDTFLENFPWSRDQVNVYFSRAMKALGHYGIRPEDVRLNNVFQTPFVVDAKELREAFTKGQWSKVIGFTHRGPILDSFHVDIEGYDELVRRAHEHDEKFIEEAYWNNIIKLQKNSRHSAAVTQGIQGMKKFPDHHGIALATLEAAATSKTNNMEGNLREIITLHRDNMRHEVGDQPGKEFTQYVKKLGYEGLLETF